MLSNRTGFGFQGDTIKLTVSRGQKTVENSNVGTIPNVEGKKLDKAQQLISNAGYSVGDTKEVYDEEIEKGIVIRQTQSQAMHQREQQ